MSIRSVTFALLPLAIAACATVSGEATSLTGTSWRFTSIDGQAPVSTEASLRFDEAVNASVGCNGMRGAWRLEGGRLRLDGPLVSTRMFCEGRMEQEAAVSELLSGSPEVVVDGDTLTLTAGAHSAVLTRDR